MDKETHLQLSTAINGLAYAAEQLDKALLGEKRHMNAEQLRSGPFASKLTSLAEIADGAPITDTDTARSDLLFAFSFLHFLRGGFYSALWDILDRAHVRLADMISEQEAKTLLGKHADWLELDSTLGHIHPIVEVEEENRYKTFDATFLGRPDVYPTVYYARYEIEARKRQQDER